MANPTHKLTRRKLLKSATGAMLSAPWIIPATALGRQKTPAPSDRITLGVIGIGPRGTYDLKAMLKLPDLQCRRHLRCASKPAQ